MNIKLRLTIVFAVTILGVASLVLAQNVKAQTVVLTESQIELVRGNCHNVKNTLNQLHASDALLRVNRGRVYESLSNRLMVPFSSRLSANGVDNRATLTVGSSYRDSLDAFRNEYRQYEQKLSQAIKIDCQAEPLLFHQTLEDARKGRKKVHDSVIKLHRVIDDYRSVANDILVNFQEAT